MLFYYINIEVYFSSLLLRDIWVVLILCYFIWCSNENLYTHLLVHSRATYNLCNNCSVLESVHPYVTL